MIKQLAIVSILAGAALALPALAAPASTLERDFVNPPDATKPRCYWYWMDGHYSAEGITRDLEAMKRVGIGEAYIGLVSGQCNIPAGDVQVLTEPFWNLMTHTIREGGRLGVDIGVFNSPGWSQSGGPWVKPENSMRYLATFETAVHGPQAFKGRLPAPNGFFQDVAVLAFPKPDDDANTVALHSPKVTATPAAADAAKLFDGNPASACNLEKGSVTVELGDPFTARSVTIHPVEPLNVECELQVSTNGENYRTLRTFRIDRHNPAINVGPVPMAPVSIAFPAVKARFFRFQFSSACRLGEITVAAAPRLESYAEKQLMKVFQDPQPPFDFYTWKTQTEPEDAALSVAPGQVLDITKNLSADGTLSWTAPAGDWIVLRTVAIPTGSSNAPAPPEATGLEVDKMSRTALKTHFDAYIGELLRRLPEKDRKAWKHVVADSYETGPQNWTDDFFSDFKSRYGYDARACLPVLTGRLVGSADASDRFLWDVRRMIADRVSRDYVGGLHDLCDKYGLRMWLENYGHWGFPGEFLQYGGECHEISGEFWATGTLGSVELRDASSAAHTYGKPQVFAEAFTGGPLFTSHPYSLKARQDWAYCEGINQFTLHLYIHQPTEDKPGISAPFGTEFNRHNTWFENSKSWIDYQRRASVLLQSGKYVADVAYFIGEDTPKMTGQRKPELPVGYSFDYINAEVIQKHLQVRDGFYVLPDGMRYRMLVLPGGTAMRPQLAAKIKDLVHAGGSLLGEPPTQSPSLQNYPKCDVELASITRELWGDCDGKTSTSRVFGKGHVFRGVDLTAAFEQLKVPADISGIDSSKILFIHRTSPEGEIYFICNQSSSATDIIPTFRVKGKVPELWRADTGRIEYPAIYDNVDAGVKLPLHLDPVGSVFVVFRNEQTTTPFVKLLRNDKTVLDATATTASKSAPAVTNGGTFSIAFWVKPGDATPLPSETNSGIVGMAEHRNEVFFPQHGNTFGPGESNSGVGLSVGTNGVTVYEHGATYFVPILVHRATITDWTHLTVVYKDNQPTLFVNGKQARTGLKSPRTAHPSNVASAQSEFVGNCGPIHCFGKALTEAAITNQMKTTSGEAVEANAFPAQAFQHRNSTDVFAAEAGSYKLVKKSGRSLQFTISDPPSTIPLTAWTLEFPTNSGLTDPVNISPLASWTTQTNPLVKYFSGTAVYKTQFEVPTELSTNMYKLILDLGEVHDLAEIFVNGRSVGTLWKPPFRMPLNGIVTRGVNQLEVRVINVWHNRLVGQMKEPAAFKDLGAYQPTVLGAMGCGPNDALFPSGLIGPAAIRPLTMWGYTKD